MQAVLLPERGAVRVDGPEAAAFLDGLVTCAVTGMEPETARFGALLTPQGKILVDFLLIAVPEAEGGGFLIDCPAALAPDLARRLGFYRLRAQVRIEDVTSRLGIIALSGDGLPDLSALGLAVRDPRHPDLGLRLVADRERLADAAQASGVPLAPHEAHDAHRIALGVPEGGRDFAYGDAFPHEANMDRLGGVDFRKGCYVGQEVVSRMEHRGTARTRIARVHYPDGFGPEEGAEVKAGERILGRAGSSVGPNGLALLRMDRAAEALEAGEALTAGGVRMEMAG